MEHILLPKDPIPGEIRVPYVCQSTEPYDREVSFLDYPTHIGKPWILENTKEHGYLSYDLYEKLHPTPVREQERFYQAWLFFGLLSTLLGGLYNAQDFILRDGNGEAWIYTATVLPKLGEAWKSRVGTGIGNKKVQYEYIAKCLRVIFDVIKTTEGDFDWSISLSIASVAETLGRSISVGFQNLGINNELPATSTFPFRFPQEETKSHMMRAGWCPSEIASVTDRWRTVGGIVFISRMDKSKPMRSHIKCTTRQCFAHQINNDEYQTKHRQTGCMCRQVSVDPGKVHAILKDGALPLLKILETNGDLETVDVEVVASSPATEYVAISHVWSDGMGNPFGNNLPACSLQYLRSLAVALQKRSALTDSAVDSEPTSEGDHHSLISVSEAVEPMLIWLDTLCCPVKPPEAQELAILRMRETYTNAAHVLVLDSGIRHVVVGDTPMVESLMRIFTSGWMQRLWTLQEGALARKLWFEFADGIVEFLEFFNRFRRLCYSDVRYFSFVYDMFNQSQWLGPMAPYLGQRRTVMQTTEVGHKLHVLDTGLQRRSTSVASDEALCIATLMDLSMDELLKVEGTVEARMMKIWHLVAEKYNGIPASILFLDYPKLRRQGYHWAPSTLLHEDGDPKGSNRLLRWTDANLGIPTDTGLLVKYSGFMLRLRMSTDNLDRNPWVAIPRVIPEFGIIFMDDDGVRYGFAIHEPLAASKCAQRSPFHLHEQVERGSCAILLSVHSWVSKKEQEIWEAIIGDVHTRDDGVLNFERAHRGHVWKLHPPEVIVQNWVEKLAKSLRGDPVTIALAGCQGDQKGERCAAAITAFKAKVKAVAEEALQDKELRDAVVIQYEGEEALGGFWHLIKEWYYHDYIGTKLSEEQMWCVD